MRTNPLGCYGRSSPSGEEPYFEEDFLLIGGGFSCSISSLKAPSSMFRRSLF